MNCREFGSDRNETVILLHGGGLSWWNYREEARLLENEYHVILPILDGHAGSGRPFTSIEDNAAEIISFIDEHLGGSVSMIGGLSLGGQVLLEMLSQRKDICSCALVESAAVIPSGITNALIGPTIAAGYGLIKSRQYAALQFRSLRIRQELFEDYYRDSCQITKADMIAFLKASTAYSLKDAFGDSSAELHVYYGRKETGEIRRSAKRIGQSLPGCTVHALPGLYHGEFSLNHPAAYADAVREILRGRQIP